MVLGPGHRHISFIDLLQGAPGTEPGPKGHWKSSALPALQRILYMDDPWARVPLGLSSGPSRLPKPRPATGFRHQPVSVSSEAVAAIVYPSGTAGFPKGAMLTHQGIVNKARANALCLGLGLGDRLLLSMPLFHVFGSVMSTLTCAADRSTLVLLQEFEPGAVLATFSVEGCTCFYGVPTIYLGLVQHPGLGPTATGTLRTGIISSDFVPPEVMRQAAQRLGMTGIVSCYGQTEAGSIVTHGLPGDPAPKRLETAGRPIPFQELKLVDPQSGCTVGPGEEGEIWDRSPYQMLGYRRMSEATAATLVEGGWLRTGDLGRQDTDGFLTIIGRLKDLIIRGGENICPTKVERELLTHPDVLEAYVVGIPSREYGEEVCVCLLLRPGARLDLGEEVQRHLNPRLAYYELPRYVLKMEAFPLIANGKVRRRELAALEVDLLTAQGEVILRAEERQQQ